MIVILHKTTSCDHENCEIDAAAKRIELGFAHIDRRVVGGVYGGGPLTFGREQPCEEASAI
jgi:hypothetical protein